MSPLFCTYVIFIVSGCSTLTSPPGSCKNLTHRPPPCEIVAVVCSLPVRPHHQAVHSTHYSRLSSSDSVPPAVRLIYQTQRRHARLASKLEGDRAYTAEAIALKRNPLYSDLPKFPHHLMRRFDPPHLLPRVPLSHVRFGRWPPPPPKTLAIQLPHSLTRMHSVYSASPVSFGGCARRRSASQARTDPVGSF